MLFFLDHRGSSRYLGILTQWDSHLESITDPDIPAGSDLSTRPVDRKGSATNPWNIWSARPQQHSRPRGLGRMGEQASGSWSLWAWTQRSLQGGTLHLLCKGQQDVAVWISRWNHSSLGQPNRGASCPAWGSSRTCHVRADVPGWNSNGVCLCGQDY